jgi:hypothetical protein
LTVEVERLEGMEVGNTVRGALPVVLTKNLGEVTLSVRLRYQACSDILCYPPAELAVELPVTGIDVIRE